MSIRYKSRIPIVDMNDPQSWAKDDITGLPVMHTDMVKQMEYIGGKLAWRGFMVHYKDADEPNPQLIPPKLKPDPLPIKNPRYLIRPNVPTVPSNLVVTAITDTTITLEWGVIQAATNYVVAWTSTFTVNQQPGITDTFYTITNLAPKTTYSLFVASFETNQGQSAFSDPIAATTL